MGDELTDGQAGALCPSRGEKPTAPAQETHGTPSTYVPESYHQPFAVGHEEVASPPRASPTLALNQGPLPTRLAAPAQVPRLWLSAEHTPHLQKTHMPHISHIHRPVCTLPRKTVKQTHAMEPHSRRGKEGGVTGVHIHKHCLPPQPVFRQRQSRDHTWQPGKPQVRKGT